MDRAGPNIPIQPIRVIPNAPITRSWKRSKSQLRAKDCDECVRKLRPVPKQISGVKDVNVDLGRERMIVTFDARETRSLIFTTRS